MPARAILLAMRADLGRLINFIERDGIDAGEVLAYARRLWAACDGGAAEIDAPALDRERIRLGVAERAGLCTLEPASRGRLLVSFCDSPNAGLSRSLFRAPTISAAAISKLISRHMASRSPRFWKWMR